MFGLARLPSNGTQSPCSWYAGVSNLDTGYPNSRGGVSPRATTVVEVLRDIGGYGTFAAGKWHLARMLEATAAGPFENWPLRKEFDRFYGFLQGGTDQFDSELTV